MIDIKEFIINYLNNYFLVSFIMLLIHYIYCIFNYRTIYSNKITNKILKILSVFKKIMFKMATRIENLINIHAESKRVILYTATIYVMYLIPILRWILIISIFTTRYEDD